MDVWGSGEWWAAWQSAPALEGTAGGGYASFAEEDSAEEDSVEEDTAGARDAGRANWGSGSGRANWGSGRANKAISVHASHPPRTEGGPSPATAGEAGESSSSTETPARPGAEATRPPSSNGRADLERLEARIRGMAANLAASTCEWLHLIGQFDRAEGWAGVGIQSCAAWLSWTCSVAPGTAREYVRIARMLPALPLVDEAFTAGRLSYSKVRVLAQVAGEVDEAVLVEQAQVQTVSQLERTVRAYRRGDGRDQQRKRRAVWRWDDDGMLVLSARLPPDEGALLLAALERARDDIAPRPEPSCPEPSCSEPSCPEPVAGQDDATPGDAAPVGEPTGAIMCSASGGGTIADFAGVAGDFVGTAGDFVGTAGDFVGAADDFAAADTAAAAVAPAPAGHPMPRPTGDDRQRAALAGADPLGMAGADMLVALAQRALAAGEVDGSGDDRHLLILHADLDHLVDDDESGPRDSQPVGGLIGSEAELHETNGGQADSGAELTDNGTGSIGFADDHADSPPGGRRPGVRPAAGSTLARARCHLEDGPGLDRRMAQRIACDAALVAVLHHVGEGEPLRLGRKTRTISPAQRRALRVRDGGCRFPGCHRRKHLEAHHVRHWSLLGPTDLENLVLLCRFHHMLIHEGGFRVSATSQGSWAFRDARSVPVTMAPRLPGHDGAALPVQVGDPMALLPGWRGEPFHLAETVAVLMRAAGAGT